MSPRLCSLGFIVKVFMDTVSLCVPPVKQKTMMVNTLTSVKNIELSSLTIKQSKIPLNPMKLVNVRMLISSSFSSV